MPAIVAKVPKTSEAVIFSFKVKSAIKLERKGVIAARLVALEAPIKVRLRRKSSEVILLFIGSFLLYTPVQNGYMLSGR